MIVLHEKNKNKNKLFKVIPCISEGYQDFNESNNEELNSTLLYLREVTDTHTQRTLTGEYIQAHYKETEAKKLGVIIRRMYKYLDKSKPVYHVSLTKLIKDQGQTPDKLRHECINVLKRCGVTQGYVFGVDTSYEGVEHIHAIIQGYLKPYKVFSEHYGWHCKLFENDRNNYMPDFYNTAKYCLNKIYPNKRSYRKL